MTNILEYLEYTASRLPDKAAFSSIDGHITFAELMSAAKHIGSAIAGMGLYRKPVVVHMTKCREAIVAFMGVLYAGCYYVPVDDEMPKTRIELIKQQVGAKAIIVRHEAKADNEFSYEELIKHEIDEARLSAIRKAHLDIDPVYIVFTSGSTGIPKGVIACHRSVIDYAETFTEVLRPDESTRFGMQVPLYVDACLKELLSVIKCGSEAFLIPKGYFMAPVRLVGLLNNYHINTLCWVVSALTLVSGLGTFDKVVPEYLTTVAFGSEVFPPKQFRLWRQAAPNARFINFYGPTEATGMSCYYEADRDFSDNEVIPVGKPFRNTEILIIDEEGKAAEPGSVGEIYIRGTSVTLGYYMNPEKTAECFVQNPLNKLYPETVYRTGDLGKLDANGDLVFISRKDNQIKHMGHRIELGEIELAAASVEGVGAAFCLYDNETRKIVMMYSGAVKASSLMAELRKRLTGYMLPAKLYHLELLPLTNNGKLDRVYLKQAYAEDTLESIE